MGRTGKLFAHEWAGVTPDVMAVAKGIGGGFPLGACLATEKAAVGMTPGTHGSTYGGNPLATAVGNAVLDLMLEPGFLEGVDRIARVLLGPAGRPAARHPKVVAEVRGSGLLLGLRIQPEIVNGTVVDRLRDAGLLTVGAGDNVVRLLPPLIITEAEVDEAIASSTRSCRSWLHDIRYRCWHPPFPRSRRFRYRDAALHPGARQFAEEGRAGRTEPLAGKTLAMIFEKPSTRTRVSFEVGMRQLGGDVVMLSSKEMQLGRARRWPTPPRCCPASSMSSCCAPTRKKLLELAEHATVPVINGLTDRSHPCQIMADVLTFEEHRGPSPARSSPGAATATTSRQAGFTPRQVRLRALGWPARRSEAPAGSGRLGARPRAAGSASPATRKRPSPTPTAS